MKSDVINSVEKVFAEHEFVGTSVSSCLENIVRRNIPLDNVKYIIGNTDCETRQQFELVLQNYAIMYEDEQQLTNTEEYIRAGLALWDAGKIVQYRTDKSLRLRVFRNKKELPDRICRIGASNVTDVYGENITLADSSTL